MTTFPSIKTSLDAEEKTRPSSRPEKDSFLVEVAVNVPLDQTFTYRVPPKSQALAQLGQRVLVPFGARKLTGHIIGFTPEFKDGETLPSKKHRLKSIIEILDPEPIFDEKMLKFLNWVSSYYHCPLGEVLKSATPSGINLKSMRTVSLTPKGKDYLDPQMIDTPEEHLLEVLQQKGSRAVSALKRISGITEAVLKRMEKNELITIDTCLEKVRVRVLKERMVRVKENQVPESGASLRGKKQIQVWQALQKKTEIPFAHLVQEFKGAGAVVKRLVERGWVAIHEREGYRDPFADWQEASVPEVLHLTPDQKGVLEKIETSIEAKKFETFLLHGVTGSGKTEVYLRAAQKTIACGREVMILVPEISLTTQMVKRFRDHFGKNIALMHSHLSDGERYDQWRRIRRGEVQIVIGARSAIFAPFPNLGLFIVDEEHEGAFKQDQGLMYHGRDLAIMRGRLSEGVVVLGSATPSIDSYFKAKEKKYSYLALPERVGLHNLPGVKIIDMTRAPLVYRKKSDDQDSPQQKLPIFSKELLDGLSRCLGRKEQAILLLNRRGYSPIVLCRHCGASVHCPHCAISLTFYKNKQILRCNYCEHTEPFQRRCDQCREEGLFQMGFGTETVEEELSGHFPHAKILRMDRDTTTRKGSHHRIIEQFHRGEAEILLGTQMVAKGLHFPRVTLVGVISADVALHLPDYRAGERTFQLLTQVAGRAGREDLAGEVLIQTYNPEQTSIVCAQTHDYVTFYEQEVAQREILQYPPFSRMICLRLQSQEENSGQKAVDHLKNRLQDLVQKRTEYQTAIRLLGPVVAPLARVKGQFRWQILLKSAYPSVLHRFTFQIRKILEQDPYFRALRFQVDVDPGNLL